ncbi:hypothetical protein TNCV_4782211 [Trichonephila clavipes]|nr:hypothetical protein TNCV_4782211 [Trichonephila clavipes]
MRQARHLPQRWYCSIVLQVRDVIRQFTQGTPNCNTNPKATIFGIPKEPVLESSELITSRLTGAGSLLPPVYGEAWAKGHATGTPDSNFPRYGSPHSANMRHFGKQVFLPGCDKVHRRPAESHCLGNIDTHSSSWRWQSEYRNQQLKAVCILWSVADVGKPGPGRKISSHERLKAGPRSL